MTAAGGAPLAYVSRVVVLSVIEGAADGADVAAILVATNVLITVGTDSQIATDAACAILISVGAARRIRARG